MAGNYYGCLSSKHAEFTCLTRWYFDKKFRREQWCEPCQARFPYGDK